MHRAVLALILVAVLAAPAVAAVEDPEMTTISVRAPKFPTPMQTAILGMSLTAVAVIGARVSNRNSDTMMFMVLASLAVTALMVVFSDKQFRAYDQIRLELLKQLQRPAAVASDNPS